MVASKLNAFDVQMAGTRRTMCAGFLIRSFFFVFIQVPRVVIPALDLGAGYFMGSTGCDSDTDQESGPDEENQGEHPNRRAEKETDAEESKQEQAVCGPAPKPN